MENRPDPDQLLKKVKAEETNRGKLKIFLGMCPGVGKTYAMLQAARERQSEGIDVLVGVVETHGRKDTEALLEGLAIASKIDVPYRGTLLKEMDLDTVLAIRPQLAIIDELAHTNAPGSRHPKRYQDVLEILAAGIDVYTTLNVQHVESRAEAVHQITGVEVRETVPDSVVEQADEITLIDLSPEQLRERLHDGKVYMGEIAVNASKNFFKEENLTALREMALRLAAERVSQDLREIMTEQKISGPWKAGECLLVAVGPTPFSESLIRWTCRAAASLDAAWIAVYVETSHALSHEDEEKLTRNLTLARQLGAEVIVKSGADIAETLLQVARENNVSQIYVGKPLGGTFRDWLKGGSIIQRLIQRSGDIDIHMVRVKTSDADKAKRTPKFYALGTPQEYFITFAVSTGITLICLPIANVTGYSSVSLIYLLAVVVAGMYLSRLPMLLLGTLCALLWNFLFIPPRFTFWIYNAYDAMMFAMFFVIALSMGQITSRLRERELAERKQEERVQTLYQLTKTVAVTHDSRQAIENALKKLEEIMKVQAAIFLTDEKGRSDFENPKAGQLGLSRKERSVATWTFQRQQPAGRLTDTLPESENFYLPLVSMHKSLGVLAIRPVQKKVWTLDQRNLMESFASFITVILEKDILARMTEDAKIKAESEKLQAALLDSISHELKTPLTVITGSVEHMKLGMSADQFQKLVSEIRTASQRLLQTVNGLLDMTRLDSGQLQLNTEWQDMRDIVAAVIKNLGEDLSQHEIKVKYEETLPVVKIDSRIVQQILSNLISNAATYAPQGSEINILVQTNQNNLVVSVMDHGPGIPEEDLDKIFEKFYRGKNARPGGLGLGLSIAKRFAEIHGGEIEFRNQPSGGACFTIRMPVEFFHAAEKEMK